MPALAVGSCPKVFGGHAHACCRLLSKSFWRACSKTFLGRLVIVLCVVCCVLCVVCCVLCVVCCAFCVFTFLNPNWLMRKEFGSCRGSDFSEACFRPTLRENGKGGCCICLLTRLKGSCSGLLQWALAVGSCSGLLQWALAVGSCSGLLQWALAVGSSCSKTFLGRLVIVLCVVWVHFSKIEFCVLEVGSCSGLLQWALAVGSCSGLFMLQNFSGKACHCVVCCVLGGFTFLKSNSVCWRLALAAAKRLFS